MNGTLRIRTIEMNGTNSSNKHELITLHSSPVSHPCTTRINSNQYLEQSKSVPSSTSSSKWKWMRQPDFYVKRCEARQNKRDDTETGMIRSMSNQTKKKGQYETIVPWHLAPIQSESSNKYPPPPTDGRIHGLQLPWRANFLPTNLIEGKCMHTKQWEDGCGIIYGENVLYYMLTLLR